MLAFISQFQCFTTYSCVCVCRLLSSGAQAELVRVEKVETPFDYAAWTASQQSNGSSSMRDSHDQNNTPVAADEDSTGSVDVNDDEFY